MESLKKDEFTYELYLFLQDDKFVECFINNKVIEESYFDKYKQDFVDMINKDVLKQDNLNYTIAASILSPVDLNNNLNLILSLIKDLKFSTVNSYLFYRIVSILVKNNRLDTTMIARLACRFNPDKTVVGFYIYTLLSNSLDLFLNPAKNYKSIMYQNVFVMLLVYNRNSLNYLRALNKQIIFDFVKRTLEVF